MTCTARQKVAWGCEGNAKDKIEIDRELQTTCPLRPFMPGDKDRDGISDVLWYYAAYKRGQLPDFGGLQDQPGMLMDIFRVIDGAVGTIEADQQEELKKNARSSRRGKG